MTSDTFDDTASDGSRQQDHKGPSEAQLQSYPRPSCPSVAAALQSSSASDVTCFGCGGTVQDEHILRVEPDMTWHTTCLRCHSCHGFLDETCTCFVKGGRIYCKPDYHRLFRAKCKACGAAFDKNEYVMKAVGELYHVGCFRCAACNCQLVPGDEFTLQSETLLCKADRDVLVIGSSASAVLHLPEQAASSSSDSRDSYADGNATLVKTDGIKLTYPAVGKMYDEQKAVVPKMHTRTKASVSGVTTAVSSAANGFHSSSTLNLQQPSAAAPHPAQDPRHHHHHHHHQQQQQQQRHGNGQSQHKEGAGSVTAGKTTRVRTVLNEKQLHMLRACYAANPRPDALMKEQLVDMTGLSPRVIRVWFQNKRCKDKKKSVLLKQLQQQQQQKVDGTEEKAGCMCESANEDTMYIVDDEVYAPQGSAASSQYSGTSGSPLSND